jgi:hypothetical protein
MSQTDSRFYALELHGPCSDMPIGPGEVDRQWMDASPERFAYRCLPLAIANQAGWMIPNPAGFTAIWDGGLYKESTRLELDGARRPLAQRSTDFGVLIDLPAQQSESGEAHTEPGDPRVSSHFGTGVITFSMPYLFRTPAGMNLWVKGPANHIKDGVQALEGVVETDWLPATFTMNWKLTRPHFPVRFEKGEPICMVVPFPRGLLESLDPVLAPLTTFPELAREHEAWRQSRADFNRALHERAPEAVQRRWQRDYVKGLTPSGERAAEHQTRMQLRPFRRSADEDI